MDFMFEWQEQYLTSERSERVRYCSCHENIKSISSSEPCNVLFIICMDVLNVVDKIYTATINFVRRFNSEKSCLQIKSKHLQ